MTPERERFLQTIPFDDLVTEVERRFVRRNPELNPSGLPLLKSVATDHGVPWPTILGNSRKPAILAARYEAIRQLAARHGTTETAEILGFTFPRVEHALRKIRREAGGLGR